MFNDGLSLQVHYLGEMGLPQVSSGQSHNTLMISSESSVLHPTCCVYHSGHDTPLNRLMSSWLFQS